MIAHTTCSGEEGHVLVGSEESHELWHLDDIDLTILGDIEVSPGSWEVGVEVLLLGITGESLMGLEDLGSSGSGDSLVHLEVSIWRTVLVLTLESVGLAHGSHEEVIIITGEVSWDNSVVALLFVLDGIPGVVELLGVVRLGVITSDLDVLFGIAGVGRSLGLRLNSGVGSVWWSSVGLISLVVTEELLESLVISVVVNRFEGPDGGSVLVGSGNETEEASNSKFHFFNLTNYLINGGTD